MAIEKGTKIKALEIVDLIAEKDFEQVFRHDLGNKVSETEIYYEDKFWLRSDPTVYDGPEWLNTETYSKDDLVTKGDYSWRSLIDNNLGNDPVNSSEWEKVAYLISRSGGWANFHIYMWGWNLYSNGYSIYIWNETSQDWDYVDSYYPIGPSTIDHSYALTPGRYKIKTKYQVAGAWLGTVAGFGEIRPWDNTFEENDRVRVMENDFSQLKPEGETLITANLANNGLLSHPGFLGGTEEGT